MARSDPWTNVAPVPSPQAVPSPQESKAQFPLTARCGGPVGVLQPGRMHRRSRQEEGEVSCGSTPRKELRFPHLQAPAIRLSRCPRRGMARSSEWPRAHLWWGLGRQRQSAAGSPWKTCWSGRAPSPPWTADRSCRKTTQAPFPKHRDAWVRKDSILDVRLNLLIHERVSGLATKPYINQLPLAA